MINGSLEFICGKMNDYFKSVFDVTEEKATVSNLINSDGSVPTSITDKLVICLANIEQETSIANLGFTGKSGENFQVRNQPLNINLYVIFAANFNDYNESLKFVSATVAYFQSNYVFLKKDYPQLKDVSDKLVFELLKTDYQNVYNIWSALGAKYLPSAIYKMRMLTINEASVRQEGKLVVHTNASADLLKKK
jgi:hypothetical protein